jgi:hypothetical protein
MTNIVEDSNYLNYSKRLKSLNADSNEKSVWNSIDRPMKPLIYEMHRIGIPTKFSCCGFSYDGEEEPKSHSLKKCYVIFQMPTIQAQFKAFLHICNEAKLSGWNVRMGSAFEWEIYCSNFMEEFYSTHDLDESIHAYEAYAIYIFDLVKKLRKLPSFNDDHEVTIYDGNSNYKTLDEWQVKPKSPCVITYDENEDDFNMKIIK